MVSRRRQERAGRHWEAHDGIGGKVRVVAKERWEGGTQVARRAPGVSIEAVRRRREDGLLEPPREGMVGGVGQQRGQELVRPEQQPLHTANLA